MFPFAKNSPAEPSFAATEAPAKNHEAHPLDALTHGAFSAHTSSQRMALIRQWLASEPPLEQLQQVYKEISAKDKGAAKLLREKLNDIKRSKTQANIAQEWAERAQGLLSAPKLNLADALAWQRDAAKAGAPLSKEPLAGLKAQLADQVRAIEDLQHRVQVQREAAVLVAQRIEVLSTKPWQEAQQAQAALGSDIEHWQLEATNLEADPNWPSVEVKFVTQLHAAQAQLQLVWQAFVAALAATELAAQDASAPLPKVPVWADELRLLRGVAVETAPKAVPLDPELKAKATAGVLEALTKLEQEISLGHGKASASAANALRHALKEFGRYLDDQLEQRARSALAGAGELEGWQRWRADQLRTELVAKAEALLQHSGHTSERKLQETLRNLREQWKQTDQGGVPNHGLWKRFDDACNQAHKLVEAWLDKVKAETAKHRAQRLALIEEVKAWAGNNQSAKDDDWKGFSRVLHQFSERWRNCGHVGDKLYAELSALWRTAISEAGAPLQALQKISLATRQALIDEAKALSNQEPLHIDAIKTLQQRWQLEAQRVPLERNHEQKLWDAFRQPIDAAFARKSVQREKAQTTLSERDQLVLAAAKALQAANAAGQAPAIKAAMAALQAALNGQAAAPTTEANNATDAAKDSTTPETGNASTEPAPSAEAAPSESAKPSAAKKPVIARRGDDRPGLQKDSANERNTKFGARHNDAGSARHESRHSRAPHNARPEGERLGSSAFRAQREALEQAQATLRKLAAQAHGEALTQLLAAWQQRNAELMPSAPEFGSRVTTGVRNAWLKALTETPTPDASQALLRLEIAAEVPTPAEHLSQRRLLQLQLLTQRHAPSPAQTWGQDTAVVLAANFDAATARRLQQALKVLLGA